MKGYLLLALALLAGAVWLQTARLRAVKTDRERLAANQTAVMAAIIDNVANIINHYNV